MRWALGIPVATRTWLWGERSELKPQAQTAGTLTSLPLGTRGLRVPAPPCSSLTWSSASHFSFFPVLFFLRKKEPVSSGGHVAWVGVRPRSYDYHMASTVKGPHRISFLFSTLSLLMQPLSGAPVTESHSGALGWESWPEPQVGWAGEEHRRRGLCPGPAPTVDFAPLSAGDRGACFTRGVQLLCTMTPGSLQHLPTL